MERLLFMAIVAAAASPWGARVMDGSVVAGALWIFAGLVALFSLTQTLFGIGGFREELDPDAHVPMFDWKRLAAEPLRMLGILIAASLGIGGIALARSCG